MELGTNVSQEFLRVEQDMGRPRLLVWVRAPEEGGSDDKAAADYGCSVWQGDWWVLSTTHEEGKPDHPRVRRYPVVGEVANHVKVANG